MSLHLPTLALVVFVVLLTTTAIMMLVGLTQRTYRGYWWWTAAQGLTMLSAIVVAMAHDPVDRHAAVLRTH